MTIEAKTKARPKKATAATKAKSASKTKLVKMVRECDGKTADIHPDNVSAAKKAGYVEK